MIRAGKALNSTIIQSLTSIIFRGSVVEWGESAWSQKPWLSMTEPGYHMDGWPFSSRLSASTVGEFPWSQNSVLTPPNKKSFGWDYTPRSPACIHVQKDLSSNLIYPLTARVIGAPQMISQQVSSIFPCSPLPSGTWRTPGLSIPWCCLPTSSSVCLVFFPLSLCLAKWF